MANRKSKQSGAQLQSQRRRRNQRKLNIGRRFGSLESLERREMFATLYWDTNGATSGLGGSGAWDTSTANWTTDPTGSSATQAWNNAANDSAVFSGTAGTVTVASGIAANALAASTEGYLLQNGTIALASGTVDTASGITLAISATLVGSGSLYKTGAGTLTTTAINSYTGTTTVDSGTLQVGNNGAGSLGTGSVSVGSAGTLAYYLSSYNNTIANNISGAGTWLLKGSGASLSGGYDNITGNNSAFTGTIVLDQARMYVDHVNDAGSASFSVLDGGQILAGGATFSNAVSMTGDGWLESAGSLGALRLHGGVTWTGDITLIGDTRIGAYGNTTGTISGEISGTGNLELWNPASQGYYSFITIAGNQSNTFDGELIVATLAVPIFAKTGGATAIPGDVQFGDGTTNAQPYIRTTQDNQFGSNSVMHFKNPDNGWSRFELQGTTQTLAGISSVGGTTGGVIQNSEAGIGGTGTLIFNNDDDHTFSGILRNGTTGTLLVEKQGSGTLTITGSRAYYTGATTIDDGTFKLVDSTIFASPLAINSAGTFEANSSLGFGAWLYSSSLSGSGTFNKTGSGYFYVRGGVELSGQINVQAGILSNSSLTADWSDNTADLDISSGAFFDLRGQSVTVDGLSGAGTMLNSYAYGANVLTVGVNDGSASFGGVIAVGAPSGTSVSGSPQVEVVKSGTGTQILTGTSTYTGTTTINGGTLQVGNNGAGSLGTGSVSVGSAGTLAYYLSSYNNTIANNISGAGTWLLKGSGASLSGGYDNITGNNSAFTGTIVLDQARMYVDHVNDAGSASFSVLDGGQILAGGVTFSNAVSMTGDGWLESLGSMGALRLHGGVNWAGDITLTGNARIGAWNGATGTIAAAIDGTGDLEFWNPVDLDYSFITLAGSESNTFTGDVIVAMHAVLVLGKTGGATAIPGDVQFGDGSASVNPYLRATQNSQFDTDSVIHFNNPASGWSRFELQGTTQTLAGISSTSGTGGGVIQNSEYGIGGSGLLAVDNSDDYTFSGYLRNGTDGTLALTKDGDGALTLSGQNYFSGDLNIAAGTLVAAAGNGANDATSGALGNPQATRSILVGDDATLLFAVSNVLGGSASTPHTTIQVNGGTVTSSDGMFNTLGPITLDGGTLDSGTPHALYGSFQLTAGLTAAGTETSHLSAKNLHLPASSGGITLEEGVRLEQTGNFDWTPSLGTSTVVTQGEGTRAVMTSKREYRILSAHFSKGSADFTYSPESADLTPQIPEGSDGWISADSLADALQKVLSFTFLVNGQPKSFGGGGDNLGFQMVADTDLPVFTSVIGFEDHTDSDFNDAYITYTVETRDPTSDDPIPDCTCDCACSPANPDSGGSTEATSPGEIGLQNDSHTVNDKKVIRATGRLNLDQDLLPDAVEVRLTFNGVDQPSVFLDPTGFAPGDYYTAAAMADTNGLATGRYDWKMTLVSHYGDTKLEEVLDGHQDVINRTESEFGSGWSLPELDQLNLETGGVNLISGLNRAVWFAESGGGYTVESGSPYIASLVQNGDDSFTLSYSDGSISEFNPLGLLASRVDASGNTRTYAYADEDGDSVTDELVSITDETGRVATFTFTAGKVTEIEDFTGKVTNYAFTGDNLTTVTETDPDGAGPQASPVTEYDYNGDGLLSNVTDPLGNESEVFYDFTGRVSSVEQSCGGTTSLQSYYTVGLPDLGLIGYDADHPALMLSSAETLEYREDEAGNPMQVVRDQFGNVIKQIDALGHVTTFRRDVNGLVTRMTEQDPDGAGPLGDLVTKFTYDTRSNITHIEHADGSEESFTYDATFSQVTSHTDPLGRVTKFEIDTATGDVLSVTQVVGLDDTASSETDDVTSSFTYTDGTGGVPAGLVETMTDPLGRVTSYTYNTHALITSIVAAEGTADETLTEFEYDAADNLTATIDPLGRRTEYAYDALDRVIQITEADPDGAGPLASPVWSYEYDARGNQRFVTDPLGNVTEYVYNERNWVEQVIEADPDGAGPQTSPITSYDYDCVGNLASVIDPLSRETTFAYDELNRLETTTQPDPDGAGPLASPVFTSTYDALGNIATRTDALGNVTSYRYDALSRLVEMTAADPDGAGPQTAPVTSYEYDDAGQLVSVTDALNRVTSSEYDDLGRTAKVTLSDPDGGGGGLAPWTVYAYDKASNLLSATDRLSNATSYGYDNLNRRTSETDANNDTTEFAFDAVGNLVSLTDPEGNETTWVYDDHDRMIEETNELNATRYFSYDAIGNLIQKIDRNDRYTEYEYDNLHRLIEERWLDPTDDETVIHTLNWVYDIASQLVLAEDAHAEYAYSYDGLGRVYSEAVMLAGLSAQITLAQAFDANSRRTRFSATIGATADFLTDYTYDTLNRLTQIAQQDVVGGNTVADKRIDFGYNAAGQFTSLNRYANLAGTQLVATSNYSYDGTGRLTGLSHSKGGTTFAGYGWAFDAANRITAFANSQYSAEDVTYNYDDRGQLTGADRSGAADDEDYVYDANGNRETANGATYTTTANNRLTSDGTYSYENDAEGNRTKQTNIATGDYRTFTWDHRNRLAAVTDFDGLDNEQQRVEYAYDPNQLLVGRQVFLGGSSTASESQHFIYDGNQMTLALDDAGAVGHRYLWGPAVDQILADEVATATTGYENTSWALTDHLNSVRDWLAEEVASSGTFSVENHITLDTFGRKTAETNSTAVDHLLAFTSRYTDRLTGLQWNLNRWYDSQVGRWLTEDPIGFRANDSNLFRYVKNDIARSVDADGLKIMRIAFVDTGTNDRRVEYIDIPEPLPNVPGEAYAGPNEQVLSWAPLTADQSQLEQSYYAAGGTTAGDLLTIFNAIATQGEYLYGTDTCARYRNDLAATLTGNAGQVHVNAETWDYTGSFPAWNYHAAVRFSVNGVTIGYADNGWLGGYFGDHIFFQGSIPPTFDAGLNKRCFRPEDRQPEPIEME